MQYYTRDLAQGVKKYKTLMNFDGLLYMFGIPMMLLTLMLELINTILFLGNEMTYIDWVWSMAKYGITTFIIPIIIAIIIMKLDGREIKPMIKGILCYPLFMGSWIIINLKCLIKPNTNWEKINHVRDIKIREMI